jgi:hypothetical protein
MPVSRPEEFWPVEDGYQEQYDRYVGYGAEEAARSNVAIVAIARNALPYGMNTLGLIDELAGKFHEAKFYCFENDSNDDTAKVLDAFAATRPWVTIEHDTLLRPDYRGFQPERTVALAEYRNRCRLWVEHHDPDAQYVVVLDMDPHGGFSVDGVLNSVGWMREYQSKMQRACEVGCMASYSLYVRREESGAIALAQYDSYAARLSWWENRRNKIGDWANLWFHALMPPVGGDPIPMYSAFGGLAVYKAEAFRHCLYGGGDCEHVVAHKAMRQAGYGLWLNPGCRYVAILPEDS